MDGAFVMSVGLALPIVLGLRWRSRLLSVLAGMLLLGSGTLLLSGLLGVRLSWGSAWLGLIATSLASVGLYFASACVPGAWCLRLDAEALTIRSAWREQRLRWAAIGRVEEFSAPKAHIRLTLPNAHGLHVSVEVVVRDVYALHRKELAALLRDLHRRASGDAVGTSPR